jgi:hypothetical protein
MVEASDLDVVGRWQPPPFSTGEQEIALAEVTRAGSDSVAIRLLRWPEILSDGSLRVDRNHPLAELQLDWEEFIDWKYGFMKRLFKDNPEAALPDGTSLQLAEIRPGVGGHSQPDPERFKDLHRLTLTSHDLTETLRQATQARFVPHAWAVWFQWRGDSDRLTYIVRAASRRLKEASSGREPSVRVDVYLGDDVESFDTVRALDEELSVDAQRHMDGLSLAAKGDGLELKMWFAKKRAIGPEWLKHAIVLEASSQDPRPNSEAVRLRDRMVGAMQRGEAAGSLPEKGDGFQGLGPQGLVWSAGEGPREKVETRSSPVLLTAVVIGMFFVVFSPVLTVFEGAAGSYVALGTGAAIGLIVGLVAFFHIGIVLGRSDRVVRLRRLALVLLTPLIGALASTAVKEAGERVLGS